MKPPDPVVFGPADDYGPVPAQRDWRGLWQGVPLGFCLMLEHGDMYWAAGRGTCWLCGKPAGIGQNRLIA